MKQFPCKPKLLLQQQFELLLIIARMNYYEIIKTTSDSHLQHTLNDVIKEQEKVI